MVVLPSTLSGFRLRCLVGEIQKDLLKPRGSALVSATAGTSKLRSASFPGIEVSVVPVSLLRFVRGAALGR